MAPPYSTRPTVQAWPLGGSRLARTRPCSRNFLSPHAITASHVDCIPLSERRQDVHAAHSGTGVRVTPRLRARPLSFNRSPGSRVPSDDRLAELSPDVLRERDRQDRDPPNLVGRLGAGSHRVSVSFVPRGGVHVVAHRPVALFGPQGRCGSDQAWRPMLGPPPRPAPHHLSRDRAVSLVRDLLGTGAESYHERPNDGMTPSFTLPGWYSSPRGPCRGVTAASYPTIGIYTSWVTRWFTRGEV
jgi:hypothetical protein